MAAVGPAPADADLMARFAADVRAASSYRPALRVGTVARFAADVDLLGVSTGQITAWLDEHARSPRMWRSRREHLTSFYRWAVDAGLLVSSPAEPLARPPRAPVPVPVERIGMRTGDAITHYLAELAHRRSTSTVRNTRPVLVRVALAHDGDLFHLTAADHDRWLDSTGIGARTRRTYVSTLAGFYRWAVRNGCTDRNPADDATRLRTPRAKPRPVRGGAIERALDAADDRMRAWLCLMAYAGLRCCEVAALRAEDVVRDHRSPVLRLRHGTKGATSARCPLSESVERALLAYGLPDEGPLFRRPASSRPVGAWYVSRHVNRHLHALGIRETAHQLRHSFGTDVYRATLDIRATQEVMGHLSPATTAVYAAADMTSVATVIRTLGRVAQPVAVPPPLPSADRSPLGIARAPAATAERDDTEDDSWVAFL
jgi:integrase/recombinase XerC